MRVYLAGPIFGEDDVGTRGWRAMAKSLWPDALDPMRRDYRGRESESAEEIVRADLEDIRKSDAVVAWYIRPSVGTSMEMVYARLFRVPVIVVAPTREPLPPWLTAHSNFVCHSLEAAAVALDRWFS